MKSDLPKVLQPLAGRPLLSHVVATAKSLHAAAIHVVHGHDPGMLESGDHLAMAAVQALRQPQRTDRPARVRVDERVNQVLQHGRRGHVH